MVLVVALLAAAVLPAESRQLVLSLSAGWDATEASVRRYQRDRGGGWRAAGGAVPASLGRKGLAWGRGLHPSALDGPAKREGDGRSPAGIFHLRSATGYDEAAPPGTRLPYRHATAALKCVDDPGSTSYNQLVDERAVARDWTSAEDMRRKDDLYRLLVWVGHNDAPAEPGAGSCIFLHLRGGLGAVTAGCTALDEGPIRELLRWLDPAARPLLVQLPRAVFEHVRVPWGLPDER
jgi:L,D-peptidoglycan transpeptidase YkuD (ErfK/YbiS/YcfS/YnhG family)